MLEILERFHQVGFVHNDIKPQNIMTKFYSNQAGAMHQAGNFSNQLFLIDYGLTTNLADQRKYKFKGTPYFASNNALQRIGAGPKDDIESLIYILVYFYRGELPWQRALPVFKDDAMSGIQLQKVIEARNPDHLCGDMEPEFSMMLSYLQELNSKQKPNYKMLRSQFEVMKERNHLKYSLEWITKHYASDQSKQSFAQSNKGIAKPGSPQDGQRMDQS